MMSLDEERPALVPMTVRCHRCEGAAVVFAPFSQAPEIVYPEELATQCQELEDRRRDGRADDREVSGCEALRRALVTAMGGRDD